MRFEHEVLEGGEKPAIKGRYAHMMPEDVFVWREFVRQRPSAFDWVWYDVHVGKPMEVPAGSPLWMQSVVDGVSRKRIDVVGQRGRELVVVEIKPLGNMTGLGQVVVYRDLLSEELPGGVVVAGMLVCGEADRDVLGTADRLGVEVVPMGGVVL